MALAAMPLMLATAAAQDFCSAQNVTYQHRAFDIDAHNWCPVPGGGADALLFGALAVFVGCALFSRLSAVWVLLAGGVFRLLSFYFNLDHFSNALTLWLGMHPTTLFFQIFLPPLLLDSAIRTDFFLFKKLAVHALLFAFVNVVLSTLAFIPVMLYGLGLSAAGWTLIDAALFGAMLGSTDAVAVTAILKAGGAPEMLAVLLEGESLFNDASSIVLFEVFLERSMSPHAHSLHLKPFMAELTRTIAYLVATGAAMGLFMGLATRLLYKLLHRRRVPPYVELSVSLAGAYTVYLVTEDYINGSGVIAVVVYGLYGASSYLYGLSSKGLRSGAFFKFLDVVGFMINSMVFFFVGSSIMHFFLSLSEELFAGGSTAALLQTLGGLPLILLAMFLLRGGLILLEAPFLSLVGPVMSWQEVLFSTVGGLRGGLALILVQTVLASHGITPDARIKVVHAQMALWVSGVVLFTLTVNAAALGPLMKWLGLNKTTPLQRRMHRRAYAELARYTQQTIADLRVDDDEMMRGVDWKAVEAAADASMDAKTVLKSSQDDSRAAKARRSKDLTRSFTSTPKHSTPRVSTETVQNQIQSMTAAAQHTPFAAGRPAVLGSSSAQAASSAGPKSGPSSQSTAVADSAAAAAPGRSSSSFSLFNRFTSFSSSTAAQQLKAGGLTVPLLGKQYRGRERYSRSQEADSDDSDGGQERLQGPDDDIEAGQTRTVQSSARTSGEAVFIASRLHQQDQELAQHAAGGADCPFLNIGSQQPPAAAGEGEGADGGSPAAAAGADASDGGTDSSSAATQEATRDGSEASDGSADTADEAAAAESAEGDAAAAAAAAGGGGSEEVGQAGMQADDAAAAAIRQKPRLKVLEPVVPVCMKDVLSSRTRSSSFSPWQHPGLSGHSAASQSQAAAAAAAATQAAMASSEGLRALRRSNTSFIAAATAATTAAGALGIRRGGGSASSSNMQQQHLPEELKDPEALRRSGVKLLRHLWQKQHQHQHVSAADTMITRQHTPEAPLPLQPRAPFQSRAPLQSVLLSPASSASLSFIRPPGAAGGFGSFRARHDVDPAAAAAVGSSRSGLMDLDELSEESEDEMLTQEEYLEECRESLLTGLKRHFRFKAAEGLLSKTSLRLLDYACDAALSQPKKPLNLWKECSREFKGYGLTGQAAALHLQLRRYQAKLLRQQGAGWTACGVWSWLVTPLINKASLLLRRWLGKVAVTALEVALELWLALTLSPLAKFMRRSTSPGSVLLQEEMRSQDAVVWRFIMDRQLEAPDEFASLQTHRVKLAVARRQLGFVERLVQIGAVEEAAGDALQDMVERRLHRLESRGPAFQTPGIMDVLRRLPYLAAAPEDLLLWLRAYGELKPYAPGQCIIPHRRSSPPGVFIVLSGLVRVEVERPGGRHESRFVGVGGSVGLTPSIVGRDLPGTGLVAAYGQGNALGRGPLVLHLPMRLMDTIRMRAAPAIEAANTSSSSSSTPISDWPTQQATPSTATSATTAGPAGRSRLGSDLPHMMYDDDDLPTASGLRGVRNPSAAGTAAAVAAASFAQLLLDLHRQVGVMLLDRMGCGVVAALTQHLELATQAIFDYVAQLPPPKALPTLQRLLDNLLGGTISLSDPSGLYLHNTFHGAGASTNITSNTNTSTLLGSVEAVKGGAIGSIGGAPDAAGATAAAVVAVAAVEDEEDEGLGLGLIGVSNSEAAVELLRTRAAAAAARLRDLMRGATLLTLAAGEPLTQSSTIVVLNGCLRLCGSSSSCTNRSNSGGTNLGLNATPAAASAAKRAPGRPSKNVTFLGGSLSPAGPSDSAAAATVAPGGRGTSGGGSSSRGHLRQIPDGSLCKQQYNAPALLAWGPEVFASMEDSYDSSQPICYTAGPAGALLLVTQHSSNTTTSASTADDPAALSSSTVDGSPLLQSGLAMQQQQQRQQVEVQPRLGPRPCRGCTTLASLQLLEKNVTVSLEPDEDDV